MKILAKLSGLPLQEHIEDVLEQGKYIQESFPISFRKYSKYTQKDLGKRLRGAITFHDDGKAHKLWQDACIKDYKNYVKWKEENKGNFEDFSKNQKEIAGKYLRKSGVRHEISSLDKHIEDNFSLPVKVAIAAHHSKLSKKHENRWIDKSSGESSLILWEEFVKLNGCFRNFHDFEKAIKRHYEYSGIRAYLQLADHRGSAKENNDIVLDFTPFSYQFPKNWKKRVVQKLAERFSDDELLLLRAPTGSGKTDASLLWASQQIKKEKAERLVVAMPTRFTSNALSISVANTLSDTGLYHSSAWFNKYEKGIRDGKIERKLARKEHELARQLLTPVTVCTIDHLLMALSITREEHHSIMFNLANSCVVLDEADFYDDFTQANILVLLKALKILNVPVMIMSASLPESSLTMYQSIGYKVQDIKEDDSDNQRTRCELIKKYKYDKVNELKDILELCLKKGTAIIYANTVAKAFEFYNWFSEKGVAPILYHSRFTEPHKEEKESILLQKLGKKAWENGTAKGIAILTQIGEMSVNISADIMLTDLCPMDRLVQRTGRLCRFDNKRVGQLFVLIPQRNGKLYPAPYGSFSPRKGWNPNEALKKTKKILTCKKYSATDFVNMVNSVYKEFEHFSGKAEKNATLLKQKFISNWVILPKQQSKESDVDNQEWKTRDIVGTDTVFVKYPETNSFYFWQDFQEFKVQNAIDISSYLIKKGINNYKIINKKIYVSGEEMTIFIALNAYDINYGLQLTPNSINDHFL